MNNFTKVNEYAQNMTNQILTDNNSSASEIQILKDDDLKEALDTKNSVDDNININQMDIHNLNIEKIEVKNANTTNCLALTIKEEHKLVAIKNVFIHSLKVTWKVIVSTVALHILKIFF